MIDLSVVVTLYNQKQYIHTLIPELLKQAGNNVQIIVVDDHSTDGTKEEVLKYDLEGKIVYIYNEKNEWVSEARNIGMKTAVGKYITFIDGDDYVKEDYIDVLLFSIQSERYDVIHFDFDVLPIDNSDPNEVDKALDYDVWTRCYRMKFLKAYNCKFDSKYKEQGYGEAYDFNVNQVYLHEPKELEIVKPLYVHRWLVEGSLSNTHKEGVEEID